MEKDIDRIPKNADTDIVIRIDEYGGRRGITIREFVRGDRYTGFTKSGTKIPVEHFKAFKEAINAINEDELMEGLAEMANSNQQKQSTFSKEKTQDKPAQKTVSEDDDIGEEEF